MKLSELKPGMEVAVGKNYSRKAIVVQIGGVYHVSFYSDNWCPNRNRVDPDGKHVLVAYEPQSPEYDWVPEVVPPIKIISTWSDYVEQQAVKAEEDAKRKVEEENRQEYIDSLIQKLGCGQRSFGGISLSIKDAEVLVEQLSTGTLPEGTCPKCEGTGIGFHSGNCTQCNGSGEKKV